jgi:hypothetical protein
LFRVVPIGLAASAVWLLVTQPLPDAIDHDALIGVAGILATVLSIAFAVTLLVAQHTAERHARVLYVEFRRESAWRYVLGALAVGVALIVGSALWRPTLSTGWAALAITVLLGLFTASLFGRLLDSLDATLLADRLTDRTVKELVAIASRERPYPDKALKPVAERGIEIARLTAIQGITSNDIEVVRAGFRGIRRAFVAYIEGSSTRGWDGEVATIAFNALRDATERAVRLSPVILLPVALEELTTLGVESQRTLEEDGAETVSVRLNSLLFDVLAQTLTNDQSAAAAMATSAIGTGALALIRARSPNMVSDHIAKLRAIAIGSLGAQKDHVAGQAHVELSKIAISLAEMEPGEIMPAGLFEDACDAFGASVDVYINRASTSGRLANDWAWNYVTMPHMQTNLAWAVIGGVVAYARSGDRYRRDFGQSAYALVRSLVRLASADGGGFSTQSNAAESAYMAVLGAIAVDKDAAAADLMPRMWHTLAEALVEPGKEKRDEVEMLSGLLLVGAYEAVSSRPWAEAMTKALGEALEQTASIKDEWQRGRRARAWMSAGRAALGSSGDGLANSIAKVIAPELRETRNLAKGSPWRVLHDFQEGAFDAMWPTPKPEVPMLHLDPDVISRFNALLDKYEHTHASRAGHPKQSPVVQGDQVSEETIAEPGATRRPKGGGGRKPRPESVSLAPPRPRRATSTAETDAP